MRQRLRFIIAYIIEVVSAALVTDYSFPTEVPCNLKKKNQLTIYVQFSSVTQSCPTLQPHGMQHTRLPVHHQLPELTQTHVQVSDAIQPSHPLSSPSPPAFNLSQHQGLSQ